MGLAVRIAAGNLIGCKAWRHAPTAAAFVFPATWPTCGSHHLLLTKEDILVEQASENLSGARTSRAVSGGVSLFMCGGHIFNISQSWRVGI